MTISAEALVKKISSSDATENTKVTAVQLYFTASMNDELELLANYVGVEMEVDVQNKLIQGAISRGNPQGIVLATIEVCRKQFSQMLREHQRHDE